MEEKLSYSFALAISIKLSDSEEKINGIVDLINKESNFELSKILLNYKRKRHFRRLGSLYLVRAEAKLDINLLHQIFIANISDDYVPQYKAIMLSDNVKNSELIRDEHAL